MADGAGDNLDAFLECEQGCLLSLLATATITRSKSLVARRMTSRCRWSGDRNCPDRSPYAWTAGYQRGKNDEEKSFVANPTRRMDARVRKHAGRTQLEVVESAGAAVTASSDNGAPEDARALRRLLPPPESL